MEQNNNPLPMRFYLYSDESGIPGSGRDRISLLRILENVARSTDTSDLVVVLYIAPGVHLQRGTAYVTRWLSPSRFIAARGHWSFCRNRPVPGDLPEAFKLIRMRLDGKASYPRQEIDGYGWLFRYGRFEDHLSLLFAHELHHFRRHHLGLHPGEGEQSANRWALSHVLSLGFDVDGRVVRRQKRKRRRRYTLRDPFRSYRGLGAGDRVRIGRDPRGRYEGQTAEVMRPIRSNSRRIVVRTPDGRVWRWPMNWIEPPAGPQP